MGRSNAHQNPLTATKSQRYEFVDQTTIVFSNLALLRSVAAFAYALLVTIWIFIGSVAFTVGISYRFDGVGKGRTLVKHWDSRCMQI
jgi:hypothetical protein